MISTAGTDLDVNIPVISGVPFLTGIGKDQVLLKFKILLTIKKEG